MIPILSYFRSLGEESKYRLTDVYTYVHTQFCIPAYILTCVYANMYLDV